MFLSTMLEVQSSAVNTLRPRQNGRRFADDTFKGIFLNENVRISMKISLKFVPKGPINNNPALFQIMAWRRSGDKPLSEPMMVSLLTHICVTRPQWVKALSDMTCFCIWYDDDWDKIGVIGYIHTRHSIARPHGRVVGCVFVRIWVKIDRVIKAPHYCMWFYSFPHGWKINTKCLPSWRPQPPCPVY